MRQWDKVFRKHGRVFTEPHEDIEKIAELFRKKGVKRILDLGSGTGRHVVDFARKGFEVYGFDISESGIQLTRNWLKEEELQANLKIGSIYQKLPYKNNFFDAVISTGVIHHETVENIKKAIREIERILKPNGLIFMTVRKRKFRKFYPKSTIIERYGKQKSRYQVIDSRTYVPLDGPEKGLKHFLFNKSLIRKEFKNFKLNIWVDSEKRHYCFSGELKSKF
ncbi:MAG: class I SAM-dependent methyltransferase [Patescibacteria group bacterium]